MHGDERGQRGGGVGQQRGPGARLQQRRRPGELGQRVYDNVSAEAWRQWEERMKMILNEYRLMPWQKEAQELVAKHMEEFFFGEGAALPPGYVPEQSKLIAGLKPRRPFTPSPPLRPFTPPGQADRSGS